MFPSVGVILGGRPSLLLSFLVAGAKWMVTGEMCVAYCFVVALNVDDARRWIGADTYFAIRPVLQ